MKSQDKSLMQSHGSITGPIDKTCSEESSNHLISSHHHYLNLIKKAYTSTLYSEKGRLSENIVESIFDSQTTKSKTNLYIKFDDHSKYNISVKKNLSGQIYLINDPLFISGFETHFHKEIPSDVKRAITLFWGSASEVNDISDKYSSGKIKSYERRKHRLVADTIYQHNPNLYLALINWFIDNSYEIADFCFSKGLAKNPSDWADLIWYKNAPGERPITDDIIPIEIICKRSKDVAKEETYYGHAGGGTTIQLPFGFVQWHQGQMQFHQKYQKIKKLISI